ncbi:MAG: DoxX family protein [Rhodospirillaceae bacterium]|nr:DoxX family protein [Rhodospirillaceae bacterium]
MSTIQHLAAPVGRVLISLMFVVSGVNKISGYTGTQGYMEAMGVPGELLPLVIALEIGGGLAIIVGWQTRLAALALAGFSLLSALMFHANFADQMQMIMFMKNVSIAGGFLFLVAHGAGEYALDNRTGSRVALAGNA